MDLSGQKTILVTGGAGFVGSNLIARLVADGHRVISLDNYFAGSHARHVAGAEYREGHTKDALRLVPEPLDLIFHLGEYSRVEQSLEEPDVVLDLNIVGTQGVLELWRAQNASRLCKLVYAASSTKFGDDGEARDATPYAWSKATNVELIRDYGSWYALPFAITYFYNAYGEGERSGRYGTVIAMFKEMYRRGEPIAVTAPGTQRRNFTHVSDIVAGLIAIAQRGEGDGYALGNPVSYAMLDVAALFGREIVMLPERRGNRMGSAIDISRSTSVGWEPRIRLEDHVREFLAATPEPESAEKRVLVFTTTFHPVAGPAEDALCELMRAMPGVRFDIVTTAFSKEGKDAECPVKNATVHRVGTGSPRDKYLLPLLGFRKARELAQEHRYLFAWSLMASYAALAGLLFGRTSGTPLLVTLADQRIATGSLLRRLLMGAIIRYADQVYAHESAQESAAVKIARRAKLTGSMGEGDAFANQIRFVYADFLSRRLMRNARGSRSRSR